MLLDFAIIAFFLIAGLGALLPSFWAWRMILDYYRRSGVTPAVGDSRPRAAVVLCLRGVDPSLERCLSGLLRQDYPSFHLYIVFDNAADKSWSRVHEILAAGIPPHIDVHTNVLKKPCSKCSLKVCSQLQAVSELPPDIDVVAFIDADSIPAPDWLRAMIAPLCDPAVGATSGIRWFAPFDCGWGSLVRHVFNSGSYPQMHTYDHAWGGSLAIRSEVFRRSNLKDCWERAFCEDGAVAGPLRAMGLKLVFVPAATHINTETITFENSIRFIQRQFVCTRLDHVDWPILLASNMFHAAAVLSLIIAVVIGIAVESMEVIGAGVGILALFAGSMYAALMTAECLIRRNYRLRGLAPPPLVWTWKMLPAFFLTQVVCMVLLVRAHFAQQVTWRGIQYNIDGPGKIQLEKYEPYQPPDQLPSEHSTL